MSKGKLKRLLEWCPRPEKPLTITLKRYAIPTTILISVSIVLTSFFLLSPSSPTQPTSPTSIPAPPLPPEVPTLESDYYPGVSVGDYVTYGNFACNVTHPTGEEWSWISCLGDVDWKKVEVIGVSGKDVTLRYTEQLKNGSATDHSGCVHVLDIEHPSWINGTCKYQGYYFGSIVVANITEGDSIHSSGPCAMPMHVVAKTEIRTYLGVSRWVNIMKEPSEPSMATYVFDGESGMLLEYEYEAPNNERTVYSITETNIFSSPTPSPTSPALQETTAQSIPTEALYAILGSIVIVIIVAIAAILKRKLSGGENDKG